MLGDGHWRKRRALPAGAAARGGCGGGRRALHGGRAPGGPGGIPGRRVTKFAAALEQALGEPASAPVHVASQVKRAEYSLIGKSIR